MLVGDSGWEAPYGCSPGVTAGGGGSGRLEDGGREQWLPTSALPCKAVVAAGVTFSLGFSTKYPKALIWGARVSSNAFFAPASRPSATRRCVMSSPLVQGSTVRACSVVLAASWFLTVNPASSISMVRCSASHSKPLSALDSSWVETSVVGPREYLRMYRIKEINYVSAVTLLVRVWWSVYSYCSKWKINDKT